MVRVKSIFSLIRMSLINAKMEWRDIQMDIALLSMALSQGQVNQQASISVLKKAMDTAEGNADFLNKMLSEADVRTIQQAVQPHLGASIDLKG